MLVLILVLVLVLVPAWSVEPRSSRVFLWWMVFGLRVFPQTDVCLFVCCLPVVSPEAL